MNSTQPPIDITHASRAMQWTIIIFVQLATFANIACLIFAIINKDTFYAASSLGSAIPLGFAWRSIIRFHFRRKEDDELDKLRILHKTSAKSRNKQSP